MPKITVLAITPFGYQYFPQDSVLGALAMTLAIREECPASALALPCFDDELIATGEAPIRDVQLTTRIVNRLLHQSRPVPPPAAL